MASDKAASSILAIHPGALGDIVLLGHLLTLLEGLATLVAGGEKGKLLEGLGIVARAVDFDSLPMQELFADLPADRCTLPARLDPCSTGYDRLVSFFPGEESSARLRLATMCQADTAAFLPVRPGAEFEGHLLELWCDLLGVELTLTPERRREFGRWAVPATWRAQAGETLAVIHPGSGGRHKCWPIERFVELAGHAPRALFVLGPAELERWGEAAQKLERQFPVLRAPSLELLAGVLSMCGTYVGNDSGVSHLSAAVGARTVAIFGPTSAVHFSPLGPDVRVVAAPSLAEISVGQVRRAME